MLTTSLLLIVLIIVWIYLSNYIKQIRTGDPDENDRTYWMFSYDFKSKIKKDFVPEETKFVERKRARNSLIMLLYIITFIIFVIFNSFIAHVLEKIVN
jgi:nitrate/nitrite transporter NarK